MKKIFALLFILFVTTTIVNAQFIYKGPIRKKGDGKTKNFNVAGSTSISLDGLLTTATIDMSNLSTTGTILINNLSPTGKVHISGFSKDKPEIVPQEEGQSSFLFGGGSGENIAAAEFLSGNIGANAKFGRLSLGGAVSKAEQGSSADLKALLQGGGNFFISHIGQVFSVDDDQIGHFMMLTRVKMGAILPSLGTSTNVVQAYFDPGIEFQFHVSAKKDNSEVIGLVGMVRFAGIWASKEYSESLKMGTNFLPYSYVSFGVSLKNTISIVFSQQFFNKENLITDGKKPAASLGLSLAL